jgi:hypothetical protein
MTNENKDLREELENVQKETNEKADDFLNNHPILQVIIGLALVCGGIYMVYLGIMKFVSIF